MKKLTSLFVLILLTIVWNCGPANRPSATPADIVAIASQTPKPAWLIQHPVDPSYYIGIGSAAKSQYGAAALKSAQDQALADLASQITVTITSDIVTTLIEQGELTRDEYLATARSQAVADLEGHEFVDSWQDANYQYAYYRLSKAKYAAIQAGKRQAAIALAIDQFQKAQAAQVLGNFSAAFTAALQAFEPLIPYLNEALTTTLEGNSVILSNSVDQLIKTLVGGISLKPNQSRASGKLGKPVATQLTIFARDPEGRSLRFLPLHAAFKKGAGDLIETLNTGSQGICKLEISSITSGANLQIVEVTVDLSSLMAADLDPILVSLVQTIPLTTTRIILDVSNPTIYLTSHEVFNGQELKQLQIEPLLKNHFVAAGFHFVDHPEHADWQMTLRATATQGTEFSGMYTVFADVNLNVVDRQSGEEIYKNALSRVKGIDLNYTNAANKALSTAAIKLNQTVIPQILANLK